MDENNLLNGFEKNYFYLQGRQALNSQSYDQAINHFGKSIEINPGNHNFYLDRAYAYLQNEQFDRSLNDYESYKKK